MRGQTTDWVSDGGSYCAVDMVLVVLTEAPISQLRCSESNGSFR